MKKIGIVVKSYEKAVKKANELEKWLKSKGIDIVREEIFPPRGKHLKKSISLAPSDLFCIFVLGGDGKFLSAVRWVGDRDIPIIGVKFGEVGFLVETAEDSLFSVAESILNNVFTITRRMHLLVKVVRDGRSVAEETVLNDVVNNGLVKNKKNTFYETF